MPRARVGVSLYFFTNGLMLTGIMPRYPQIKDGFGLSHTEFGFLVAVMSVGAIAASLLPGPLIRFFGARTVVMCGTILLALAMVVLGFAPIAAVFALGLFLFGVIDAIIDAAQNVHGVNVENAGSGSIINSLHALWSLGAATGGLVGVAALRADISLGVHLSVVGVLGICLTALGTVLARLPDAAPLDEGVTELLADDPPVEDARALPHAVESGSNGAQQEVAGGAATGEADAGPGVGRTSVRKPWLMLILLGLLATSGTLLEDVAQNWSSLYLNRVAGMAVSVAGFGYVLMISAQFIGRLLGDPMTDRWGRQRVAAFGGVLVVIGSGLAGLAPYPATVLIGFGLIGFGCATLVPAAYAAAGNLPGFAEGTGITVVGWMMRVGFLATSPIIGIISDAAGMRWAMLLPAASGAVAVILSLWSARRLARA